LLAIGVLHDDRFKVWGTALMIGPGLALTATHVLANHHEQIRDGEVGVVCAGMRKNGTLELWSLRHLGHDEGDLTILSLQLATPLLDGGRFTSLPLSTRTPVRGERLSVVGFRLEAEAPIEADTATVEGWLYAAAGEAGDVSHPVRAKILAPYPTIEILCGALGGMRRPVSTVECELACERSVAGGVVGLVVVPAAPEDAQPGGAEGADGALVVVAAGARVGVDAVRAGVASGGCCRRAWRRRLGGACRRRGE
jgi:hypothetical protein